LLIYVFTGQLATQTLPDAGFVTGVEIAACEIDFDTGSDDVPSE
jgi:hypothetical protein